MTSRTIAAHSSRGDRSRAARVSSAKSRNGTALKGTHAPISRAFEYDRSGRGDDCSSRRSSLRRELIVAYYAPLGVDWNTARPEDSPEEEVVVLRFGAVAALMLGSPNDEALDGHPLAARGLTAYGAFRVEQSSWVRRLEQMNRVHPQHSPESFLRLQHFVLTFHDSTFECVTSAPPTVPVLRGTTPRQAVVEAALPSE
jgi:hypothetical protein